MRESSRPGESTSTIHVESALTRLGNDRGLLQDLANFYLEDVPVLLQELSQGLKTDDADLVMRSAHSIKGLSANFDAHAAVGVAAKIEACGRAGDLSGAAESLPELRTATEEVATALRNEVLS